MRHLDVIRAAIINGGGATDFCARFLDADDQPIRMLETPITPFGNGLQRRFLCAIAARISRYDISRTT